jgi:hypothetical protein
VGAAADHRNLTHEAMGKAIVPSGPCTRERCTMPSVFPWQSSTCHGVRVTTDEHAYEARYGWSRRNVGLAAFGVLCLVIAVISELTPHKLPIGEAVFVGLFGLAGVVVTVMSSAGKKLAFRVDDSGLTMVGSALRPRPVHIPWHDIEAIVLWKQRLPRRVRMPYIGVRRRPNAPELATPGRGPVGRAAIGTLVPHMNADIVYASIAVSMWKLDVDRLSTAVTHYAAVAVEYDPSWM